MVDVGVRSVSSCFPGRKVTIHSGSICVCTFVWLFFAVFGFSRDPQHLPLGSQGTAYLKRVSKPYYLCEAEGHHGTSNLQTDQRRNQKYPKHAAFAWDVPFLSGRDASPGQLCVKLRSETFWFWIGSWWLSPRASTTWLAESENRLKGMSARYFRVACAIHTTWLHDFVSGETDLLLALNRWNCQRPHLANAWALHAMSLISSIKVHDCESPCSGGGRFSVFLLVNFTPKKKGKRWQKG